MAKDGNGKVLEVDLKPDVLDGKFLVTVTVDKGTGGLEWSVSEDGLPAMVIRDYLLKVCDRLFMNEINAQGDNRYMRRIGGIKRKGVIQ